jgi:DNA-directed RNA polymerase specialized sigma24 family protein
MKNPSDMAVSPLRRHAADALRRARKLPIGHERNNLRQLGYGSSLARKEGPASDRARSLDRNPDDERAAWLGHYLHELSADYQLTPFDQTSLN